VIEPASRRTPVAAAWVATVAALAGLGVSVYLTVVHYTEPASLSCPDTGIVNCTKVTTSDASMLFGTVPVALAGSVFFAVMLLLTIPPAWRVAPRMLGPARLLGAAGGVAMVVYLVWVEVWDLRAICLWCTVVHVLAFVLFVAVVAGWMHVPDDPEGPDLPLRRTRATADT
jgi:uncharacterized membrane protein